MHLKIVHIADLHLGASLREAPPSAYTLEIERQKDYLKQLDGIARYALTNDIDFLVIAGDIFHTPRPSGYLLDEFAKFIHTLTSKRIRVVAIPGNHDQPRAEHTEPYLKALADVGAPNFYVFRSPDVKVIDGLKSGRKVRFIALPYLSPQMIDEVEFTSRIEAKLNELKAREGPTPDYTVIVSHLYVEGAKLGAEQRIATLNDYHLPRSVLLGEDVDFICLGHIHTPQFLNEKMVYSGSIERVDFGEQDEDKGFVFVEERGGSLQADFINLDCRPLLTVPKAGGCFDLTCEANPAKALVDFVRREAIPEGAILRVLVRLGPRQTLSRSVLDDVVKEKKILYWFTQCERLVQQKVQRMAGAALPIKEFYTKYVEASLARRVGSEVLELVKKEGLRIIDEVEAERSR
ncbi:MAG: exonuclease SbcCD subunit D [Nitrososphaerales archaeon]